MSTLQSAEAKAREYWEAKLARAQRESAAYLSRKPFARAKDNRDEQERQMYIRTYTRLIAALALPADQRDPATEYDITSRVAHYL